MSLIIKSSVFKREQEPHPYLTSIVSFNTDTVYISVTFTDPYHSLYIACTLSLTTPFTQTNSLQFLPQTDHYKRT